MEQQIQLEQTNHTLPPRKTVHQKEKKDRKKKVLKIKKWNTLQIIVWLFIFLILGTAYGVYQYGLSKEERNERTPIELPFLEVTNEEAPIEQQPIKNNLLIDEEKNENTSLTSEEMNQDPSINENQTIETVEKDKSVVESEEKKELQNIRIHVVQPGETMYRISLKYYQSGSYASQLADYNQINNFSKLHAGYHLKIPEKNALVDD